MHSSGAGEITDLLRAWNGGDPQALDKLIPLVYQKLYAAAQRYMAQQYPGHILQNSALVNETYLQLVKLGKVDWQDRNHFYAVCSQMMRYVLTTYTRSRLSAKRGGTIHHVRVDDNITTTGADWHSVLLTLDDALNDLAAFDERLLRIVELRALVGLSVPEIAEALNISESTVKREWQIAKLWLLRELSRGNANGA
ncbi:MAG: ECF-type sigma factor [Terriglobales bacterium]|jgi:RNA polymerase sigma factor (TIGR02999 family)